MQSRLRTYLTLFGLCVALGAGASSVRADRVVMLIEQSLYDQVETKLLRYESEVEARFPVSLEIYPDHYSGMTPAQVRDVILSFWQEARYNLDGVILCGQIPYALWRQDPNFGSNEGPLAFFYEDLDGTFTDTDGDGWYDYHTWGTNDGPEIWSCWMRPPVMDEAGYLNDFFDETHDYYQGTFVTTKQGYVACHNDYDGNFWNGTIPSMPALVDIYGMAHVGTDGEGGDDVNASELEATIFGDSYDIVHFWGHANSTLQAWDSSYTYSAEVMQVAPGTGPLIAHIYGCHSGDFDGYQGTSLYNTNVAVAYAFGPGAGQASSGTSWSYGTEGMNYVTEKMRDGWYLGKAWKHLLDTRENSVAIQQRYHDRDVHKELSGNNLFGNPFLYANWTGPWGGDDVAPTISSVSVPLDDPYQVTVVFSESVEQTSAETTFNYNIDQDVAVFGATLGGDGRTVTLDVSTLAPATQYTLLVSNIEDLATPPNVIAPNSSATFEYFSTACDCNNNGTPDDQDIAAGDSTDCNNDGVPDECQHQRRGGWSASYYDTMDLSGTPIGRIDGYIDFAWDTGSPMSGIGADTFSVRWEGYVLTPDETGDYTFFATSDDGVRLYYEDTTIIDQWVDQSPTESSGSIWLQANTAYPLTFEYYENGGGAMVRLEWMTPSGERKLIAPANVCPGWDADGDLRPDECGALICRGDANCDGAVNWRDIDYFVAGMGNAEQAWRALFADPEVPGCSFGNLDTNGDGTVSWRDIDPFVGYMGLTCPHPN